MEPHEPLKIESAANDFENVRKAVRAYERSKVHSMFAIGDALIQDVGPSNGRRDTKVKLENCATYLATIGYDYEVQTLRHLRATAEAFSPDHRADILETFPHLPFSVFKECVSDPTLLDDCVELIERPDALELRIPDLTARKIKKRRTISVDDIKDIVKYARAQFNRAYDQSTPNPPVEVIDLTEDDERDAGEILLNIETPQMRAARDGHPSVGPRKKYTVAEMRAMSDGVALAASKTNEDELVEVQGNESDGFTMIVYADGEVLRSEDPAITVDRMLQALEAAKRSLLEFHRLWNAAGLQIDDAIQVLEKLDEVRSMWEQNHELMSGYRPEMH